MYFFIKGVRLSEHFTGDPCKISFDLAAEQDNAECDEDIFLDGVNDPIYYIFFDTHLLQVLIEVRLYSRVAFKLGRLKIQ